MIKIMSSSYLTFYTEKIPTLDGFRVPVTTAVSWNSPWPWVELATKHITAWYLWDNSLDNYQRYQNIKTIPNIKIVNFSWLLFSTLVIGQNLLTQKNTLSKWSVNAFYCVNGLHIGLCTLCVKIRTFLCGKAPLPHNKRNCYPPNPDHYLLV